MFKTITVFVSFIQLKCMQDASGQPLELRELSSTDLNFLNDGIDVNTGTLCDLDTIFDDFQADTHILLTNPDQLLDGNFAHHVDRCGQ